MTVVMESGSTAAGSLIGVNCKRIHTIREKHSARVSTPLPRVNDKKFVFLGAPRGR